MTDGLGAGAIAGIVLGALTATGVVSILGFVYYIKKIKPLHSPKLSTEDTGSKHKKSFDGIKDKSEAGGSPELDEVEMQDQRKESLDGRNSEDCVSGHSSDLPEIEIELEGQEKESSESSSEESKSEQSYDFDAIDMEGHGKESSESGSEENQMGFSGSNGTDTQDHLNKSFQGSSEESEVFI
ncbi:protein gar2-like isoform X3 [Acanthaster planci]|nr:protein gar2-like isoform X3 [Acanthaster planci]XP_022108607.1 protein gar2-like isoform X3 [Acanthaster planci]